MKTLTTISTILFLAIASFTFAANPNYAPESMEQAMAIETKSGNGIAILEMYFKDINNVQTVIIEHSNEENANFTFIKKVWGVDVAHTQGNLFRVMDTQLTQLDAPTFYKITLNKKDGSSEVFFATLAASF